MAIASVDGGLLFQVVWSSLLAGAFVTLLFSLVVVFSSRSAEARRCLLGSTRSRGRADVNIRRRARPAGWMSLPILSRCCLFVIGHGCPRGRETFPSKTRLRLG